MTRPCEQEMPFRVQEAVMLVQWSKEEKVAKDSAGKSIKKKNIKICSSEPARFPMHEARGD